MIEVTQLTATTTEQVYTIQKEVSINTRVIISPDMPCLISFNDNQQYQSYLGGEIFVFNDRETPIKKIYYKTSTGTANIRIWVM